MLVTHLLLVNFRNYTRLDLALVPGVMLFWGGNAQGKSNLLEALSLLSTGKSHRASLERELVNWAALQEELPFVKMEAQVSRKQGGVKLEMLLQVTRGASQAAPGQAPADGAATTPLLTHKRLRVNGLPRRLADIAGEMTAVLFDVEDIAVVADSPSSRRRFLDALNTQVSRPYARQSAHYARVLSQRNHLLKRLHDGEGAQEELEFWDQELAAAGAFLQAQRHACIQELDPLAQAIHLELTGGSEHLALLYLPNVPAGPEAATDAIAAEVHRRLKAERRREVAAGMSLVGPHRDDLRFTVNGVDMGVFGSRGQQRTVALSVKLAEAKFIEARTGELPVMLLDDIMAELDSPRRQYLASAVLRYPQVFITTTEKESVSPQLLEDATLFRVGGGTVARV